ncbi:hypothetical protein BD413DRAFT_613466 [Trametes elegans]|nr:hypothetical protein BD413DRAFT_613466 [Trametes elegans]
MTKMSDSIIVHNASSGAIHAFVSKYTNDKGSDDWFTIGAGQRESWGRNQGWELVAFKNEGDTERAGVYVSVDSIVTYHSLSNTVVE